MHRNMLFLFATTLVLGGLVGCSGASAAPEHDPGSDDAAFSKEAAATCSPEAYASALASYEKAVENATARLSEGACESDDGTLSSIVRDAHAAVTTCASFEHIIATSAKAKPIRDSLAGNLSLQALVGELDTKTWKNAGEALVGITLYGPAPGVYGNISKVELRANGVVVVSALEVPEDGSAPRWSSEPNGTFELGAPRASALPITLRYGLPVRAVTYDLQADPAQPGAFVLRPTTGSTTDGYSSLPSECEA